jgi:hypothetical protein
MNEVNQIKREMSKQLINLTINTKKTGKRKIYEHRKWGFISFVAAVESVLFGLELLSCELD